MCAQIVETFGIRHFQVQYLFNSFGKNNCHAII